MYVKLLLYFCISVHPLSVFHLLMLNDDRCGCVSKVDTGFTESSFLNGRLAVLQF